MFTHISIMHPAAYHPDSSQSYPVDNLNNFNLSDFDPGLGQFSTNVSFQAGLPNDNGGGMGPPQQSDGSSSMTNIQSSGYMVNTAQPGATVDQRFIQYPPSSRRFGLVLLL
jgi:hypothetical protein